MIQRLAVCLLIGAAVHAAPTRGVASEPCNSVNNAKLTEVIVFNPDADFRPKDVPAPGKISFGVSEDGFRVLPARGYCR